MQGRQAGQTQARRRQPNAAFEEEKHRNRGQGVQRLEEAFSPQYHPTRGRGFYAIQRLHLPGPHLRWRFNVTCGKDRMSPRAASCRHCSTVAGGCEVSSCPPDRTQRYQARKHSHDELEGGGQDRAHRLRAVENYRRPGGCRCKGRSIPDADYGRHLWLRCTVCSRLSDVGYRY